MIQHLKRKVYGLLVVGMMVVMGMVWMGSLEGAEVEGEGGVRGEVGEKKVEVVDFNRDVRPILSGKCFACHGFDANTREAGLRLDTREGATKEKDGFAAIVPGDVDASELIFLVTSEDPDERMPPAKHGAPLTKKQVDTLKRWIKQGAPYAKHWAYVQPKRVDPPAVGDESWVKNAIDRFVLARLEREGMRASKEADRYALIRRVSLDLTGLPPTIEEVDAFVNDKREDAYERLVDRLLASDAYGEHWARQWLDLARYADSAGYADDPLRTIWAYRDYVIRSFNENKPFDEFTIEQLAGDLLENPTQEQLIATAFHRNTQTNSEGGTDDEEFRNVAIVDRVNTTMDVWMGTTMACAQCHDHKYDPLSQKDYFQMFAIFNQSQDSDKKDERPTIPVWSDTQLDRKALLGAKIAKLEGELAKPRNDLEGGMRVWAKQFSREAEMEMVKPVSVEAKSRKPVVVKEDGAVWVKDAVQRDDFVVRLPLKAGTLRGVQLQTVPSEQLPGGGAGHGDGNFVVTEVLGRVVPPKSSVLNGRYVRVINEGKGQFLHLAEVEVMSGGKNVARGGVARQVSTGFGGAAKLAIDGNTNGDYLKKSVSHTESGDDPWWEVDLKESKGIDEIVIWNRMDNGLHTRLNGYKVQVLNEKRDVVWEVKGAKGPNPSVAHSTGGARGVKFVGAYASFAQDGFGAHHILDEKNANKKGWAVSPRLKESHRLTLVAGGGVEVPEGSELELTIRQQTQWGVLGQFKVGVSYDAALGELAKLYSETPDEIVRIVRKQADARSAGEKAKLVKYYATVAPELRPMRDELAKLKKELDGIKPMTTVPVMRERDEKQSRVTHIQLRGNFLDKGEQVERGLPEAFVKREGERPDRLSLARWLVSEKNPLSARVVVNRYWESLFGMGLVATSEEFGSQGELPSHPELLDWMAVELVDSGWDLKKMVKQIVMSATYRQSSKVTASLLERDPSNQLLARGPRFRLSAEVIRDQALKVSGLLSRKMYGPPVRPPQPNLGLKAAFGGGTDWKTSKGEDKYRRGLYTQWRRSSPYPSMATFDAPSREVCTIRRVRTNTPLQALVTLNDPVYVEAAQALGRRAIGVEGGLEAQLTYAFRLCLSRKPSAAELGRLKTLYEHAYKDYQQHEKDARVMATDPIGKLPDGADVAEYAAWAVVGNVLLNLDELLMNR